MKAKPLKLVLTCEHGGNHVPKRFAALFNNRRQLLECHRGHDPGALELAKKLSFGLRAELYFSTLTRLLIDLNRSPYNPKRFSEITRKLSSSEKKLLQSLYYDPYQDKVKSAVSAHMQKGRQVLHLSVHSFTPVLHGKVRTADLGLLYDPSRKSEAAFCVMWQEIVHKMGPDLKVRRNYPYLGTADGLTAYLRDCFPASSYLGIELEVNQLYPAADRRAWLVLQQSILKSLNEAILRHKTLL